MQYKIVEKMNDIYKSKIRHEKESIGINFVYIQNNEIKELSPSGNKLSGSTIFQFIAKMGHRA